MGIIYKMLGTYTTCDNETPGKLFRFRDPVTGVALIIYLIRVICEMPELYEMLNALVHHGQGGYRLDRPYVFRHR